MKPRYPSKTPDHAWPHLNNLANIGYRKAMYKAVFTLLLGLLLSLGGQVAFAVSKTDWGKSADNMQTSSPIEVSYKTALKYKNRKFDGYSKLTIFSIDETVVTVTAFNQWKGISAWRARGIFFLGKEICVWNSSITSNDGTGSFNAKCPSAHVSGQYTVAGSQSSSYGEGKDKNGKTYRYVLDADTNSQLANYKALLKLYLAKDEASITTLSERKNFLIRNDDGQIIYLSEANDNAICNIATKTVHGIALAQSRDTSKKPSGVG